MPFRTTHLPPEAMFPAGVPGYRVRYVRGAHGHRLRVVERGREQGPAILMVHGWGGSVYAYRHTMPALAEAGWRTVAMDLVGHGLSEKPTDRMAYTLDSLASDADDVMTSLGTSDVALAGHSMGGAVVARVAATQRMVKGLVLLSPVGLGHVRDIAIGQRLTPEWAVRAAPYIARRFAVALALRFAYAGGSNGALGPTTQDIDEYWAPAQFPEFALALRTLIHEFPWQIADPSWLSRITCPALVMAGANDRLVDPESASVYAQRVPHATLQMIPQAGHALPEQRPAEVNAALVTFLRHVVNFPT